MNFFYRKTPILITIFFLSAMTLAQTLSLDDCIRISVTRNPQVLASQHDLSASRNQRYQSITALLPSAKFQGTYTRLNEAPYTTLDPSQMPFMPPGTPAMRIEMGKAEMEQMQLQIVEPITPQLWTALGLANTGVMQKQLNLKKTKLDIVLETIKAYYRFLQAKGFLEIATSSKGQIDAHIVDLQNMFEQGIIHRKDLLKAQVQQSEVELLLLQAQHSVELARKGLCLTLGFSQDSAVDVTESLAFTEYTAPLDSVLLSTKQNSLDAKLLDIGVDAAKKQKTLALEGLLPSFSAIFNYDYKKPNQQLENDWYDSWTVVGVIQWNIFNWGGNIAKIEQTHNKKRQMEYIRESAVQGIELQTRTLYLSLDEKQKKLDIAHSEVETAQECFRVTDDVFHAGAATNAELLDAQSDLTRAKINLNNYLADYNITKFQLEYLTGELDKKVETILENER